ncbi:MAG: ATP-binding cassette domain-containing protein [Lachnospiraceae bacterium]|nr:ATP-binding cassette domain-containing protein [Lachnospiraceae bacterium]
MSKSSDLVELRQLTKCFRLQNGISQKKRKILTAVDHIDLSIRHGETLGLVGESGCGKSTLGRCIIQLTRPTSGEVIYAGRNALNLPKKEKSELRRNIQMIFQDPYAALNPRRRIVDSVVAPLEFFQIGEKANRRSVAEELLANVGLSYQQIIKYPHELSGGQRQRAVIARAIISNPSLVICDEPVSALDVSVRSQILNLLNEMQVEKSLSYLFISHDLSVVRYVCSRVAVMYLGRIVEIGDRTEIFEHPAHPYTQALLSAIPIPDVTVHRRRIILQGDVPNPVNPPTGCSFHTRCPYATVRCAHEVPQLRVVGIGHCVACHMHDNNKKEC